MTAQHPSLTRNQFRAAFGCTGPVVLPVIHVLDTPRTLKNIEIVAASGAGGCFLINHDFAIPPFLPIIRNIRKAFPKLWLGLNFLATTGAKAFPLLGQLAQEGYAIDAYWADDARIAETEPEQSEADAIARIRGESGWLGWYFGGTAFKKQRPVAPEHFGQAAALAGRFMDVVTTSGIATGEAADLDKIAAFRRAICEKPLAVASGITPENAAGYRDVDCFMVATGINHANNFYDIDPARLGALLQMTMSMELEVRV